MKRIDLAAFTCKCGHRCTAPEAINTFANEMEVYEKKPLVAKEDINKKITFESPIADEAAYKQEIESRCKGNKVTVRIEGSELVARLERSYAVAEFDKTTLEDSDHITLRCPKCNIVMYDTRYENAEQKKKKREAEEKRALVQTLELIKKQGGDINEAEALRKAGLRKIMVNGVVQVVGI